MFVRDMSLPDREDGCNPRRLPPAWKLIESPHAPAVVIPGRIADNHHPMAGWSHFTSHDPDAPGVRVDAATRAELRRLANLFLVSALTLVLLLLMACAKALNVTFIPSRAWSVLAVLFFVGAAVTYVYGLYVTVKARRWLWVALCAVPLAGSIPCSVAYAWTRRMEIEHAVLGDPHAAGRQRRGGRKRR